ncbi:MAG: SLBB domain-containing protein, partial [Alistipes sp.]
MKKFIILLAVVLLCVETGLAQKIPDTQAIEYAKECYAQEMPIEQAVRVLQSKGVSIEQMKRLKTQYENGTLDVTDPSKKSDKERTNSSMTRTQSTKKNEKDASMDSLAMETTEYDKQKKESDEAKKPVMTKQDSLNRIYGHDIFQNKKLTFEPNLQLATPTNYVVGAGDELGIAIFGSSEVDLSQTVTPEGRIYVDGLGPVSIKGLTIEQVRTKLRRDLSYIYGGLSDGSASLNVTVSNIRSIQVNVMGEVVTPGTYTMPSLATVFHALYAAGGVTETGTMRAIKVMRNNKVAGTVDVYSFLLTGDKSGDIVLQDGDIVLIQPFVHIVAVPQGVKRPMRYEMKAGETVADLLRYAGGFTNIAFRTALNITRQNDRGLSSFNVKEPEFGTFALADGDKIVIGQRYQRSENKVLIEGAVYNPGTYAIDTNVKTVKQLIAIADGLREDAFLDRALLQREMADWSLEMQSFDINKLFSGEMEDIPLRPNDEIFISSKADLREEYYVSIAGPVAVPGDYDFAEGMTIKDMIVRAGGLLESASLVKVDISRRIKAPQSTTYSPQRSQLFTVALGEGLQTEDGKDFVLQPFDQVYVRKSPSYNEQNTVTLNGEVLFAGSYALENTGVRVSEIIQKAGGITPAGFVVGASLERKMTPAEQDKMNEIMYILSRQASRRDSVDTNLFKQTYKKYSVGFDLKAALDNPGSSADIILQPGDVITIPEYNGTVQILGSVLYPNAIAFEAKKKLEQYVNDAGGYSQLARKNKVFVLYMNGTAATGRKAKIVPGCKIV